MFSQGLVYLVNNPTVLFYSMVGSFVGILGGVLPGISSVMTVALLVPLTFGMNANSAMVLLVAAYFGAIYGGSITAVLLHIPGTPSAIATCLDGYPMRLNGMAGKAIGISTISSCLGGIIGWICLGLFLPTLTSIAMRFQSYDYALLALLGLSLIATVSSGSTLRGLFGGVIGLLIACVGGDPITGYVRYAFGLAELQGGFSESLVLIGLLGVSEVFYYLRDQAGTVAKVGAQEVKRILPSFGEIAYLIPTIIRSSLIGVFLGAVPAVGTGTSAITAYAQEKRISRHPERFGQGEPRGIAASESANNACCGGALIPTLSLGIPGDPVTAVLIGGLILHGIRPGPMLMREQGELVSMIFLGLLLSIIFVGLMGLSLARVFAKMISLPLSVLYPAIMVLAVTGAYTVENSTFGIIVMLGFALLGYVLKKASIPLMCVSLGFILGPIFETNFRRSLVLSKGSLAPYFTRPFSLIIILLIILINVYPLWISKRGKAGRGDMSWQH